MPREFSTDKWIPCLSGYTKGQGEIVYSAPLLEKHMNTLGLDVTHKHIISNFILVRNNQSAFHAL